MTPRHDSMRGWFAAELYDAMAKDERIWLITADLGWGMWDKVKSDFPDRFVNPGASECLATGIAVGLALEGRIPFLYSITTFLIYRPFEFIRNMLGEERIPVRLVGSGFQNDYKHDGFTHQPWEIHEVMSLFHMSNYFPDSKEQIQTLVRAMIDENQPSFLCLRR